MNPAEAWPQLRAFHAAALATGSLTVWLFGSALRTPRPRDIDVLVIYDDIGDVTSLRAADDWERYDPPLDIIAMTVDEEADYGFIAGVKATLLDLILHPIAAPRAALGDTRPR